MLRKRLEPLTFFYEGVFMVTISEEHSNEPIKSIMLNEMNGAAGLASPQAPSLRLKCLSPPNGWRSGKNEGRVRL